MNPVFLVCALALPAHLDSDYYLLKEYIEKKMPQYTVVFINDNEKLLTKGAEKTPLYIIDRKNLEKGLRMWTIKKSA